MPEIVRIEPTQEMFYITWTIQLRCNYDCMYCGDIRHNTDGDMPNLEQLKSQWIQIFEKTKHRKLLYALVFSGGEPVINKDFLPFVTWLNDNYKQYLGPMGLVSNGSASLKHYLKLFKIIDYFTFSTHTEFFDDEKFFALSQGLAKYARKTSGKYFILNIMHEPWAKKSIPKFIDLCRRRGINYFETKHIDMSRCTRDYPIFKIKKYE